MSVLEKHIAVVQYLSGLSTGQWASSIDIKRELDLDIDDDEPLLDLLKSNPKVIRDANEDGEIQMQFKKKFEIRYIG
jgi:hypothetical protein